MTRSGVELADRSALDLIRRGEMPGDKELDTFHTSQIVDNLRRVVEVRDLEWLLPAIATSQDGRLPLLISLIARHSARSDVQKILRQRWHISSVYIQSVLMWRLLDDPLLSMDWHQRLFDLAIAEWELFCEESRRFFGKSEENLFSKAFERYCDPTRPKSKKWAYLCCIACVDSYPSAVDAILEQALSGSDPFLRTVAETLSARRYEHQTSL